MGLALTNGNYTREYLWGLDLSGSISGAGGVGGLLMYTSHASQKNYSVGYDTNGNVCSLYDLSDDQYEGKFTYTPFGKIMEEVTGIDLTFRFSTKYLDRDTGNYYYGFRWYDPVLGRWLNRDPISERGGINLYGFVKNNGTGLIDPTGKVYETADLDKSDTDIPTSYAGGGYFDDSTLWYTGYAFASSVNTDVPDPKVNVLVGVNVAVWMHIDTFGDTKYRSDLHRGALYKLSYKIHDKGKHGRCKECKAKVITNPHIVATEQIEGIGVGGTLKLERVSPNRIKKGEKCKWRAHVQLSFSYSGSSTSGWNVTGSVSAGGHEGAVGGSIGGGISSSVTSNWVSAVNIRTETFDFEKDGEREY